MITKFKDRTKHFLESKLQIEEAHRITTFLCPQFRELRMLAESEQKAVHDNVSERLPSMPGDADDRKDSSTPAKRRCFSQFQEWYDAEVVTEKIDEVDRYLSAEHSGEGGVSSLLQWSQSHQTISPQLAALARRVLCIPATTASSEKKFSAAAYVMNER